MTQLFPKSADTWLRLFVGIIVSAAVLFWPLRAAFESSAYATAVGSYQDQPIPFSHKHHVGDIGIDCRYCHSSVTKSSFAGMPTTETCMGCHAYVWSDAFMLAPLRSSYQTSTPIEWNRVTRLPDYVYFNHSIHISKGVGCETCHGRVDTMPLMAKQNAFRMDDCLACHRDPGKYLRPKQAVFQMGREAEFEHAPNKEMLLAQNEIRKVGLTDCVTCHR